VEFSDIFKIMAPPKEDILKKEMNPFADPLTSVAMSDELRFKLQKMGIKGDSEEPILINFQDICAAAFRIGKGVYKTPCEVRSIACEALLSEAAEP
jgi:translation initiation factor 2 beta subunit (eIF-2beta)/eIF-5